MANELDPLSNVVAIIDYCRRAGTQPNLDVISELLTKVSIPKPHDPSSRCCPDCVRDKQAAISLLNAERDKVEVLLAAAQTALGELNSNPGNGSRRYPYLKAVDGVSRQGKWCRCGQCGTEQVCRPDFDFYTGPRFPDGTLFCETCMTTAPAHQHENVAGSSSPGLVDPSEQKPPADAGKCPACESPAPERHPAHQHEGETVLCPHPFHSSTEAGRVAIKAAHQKVAGSSSPPALSQARIYLEALADDDTKIVRDPDDDDGSTIADELTPFELDILIAHALYCVRCAQAERDHLVDIAGLPAVVDLHAALARAEKAEQELAGIDAVLARRPAMDKPSRRENIEHAIATAAKADAVERSRSALVSAVVAAGMSVEVRDGGNTYAISNTRALRSEGAWAALRADMSVFPGLGGGMRGVWFRGGDSVAMVEAMDAAVAGAMLPAGCPPTLPVPERTWVVYVRQAETAPLRYGPITLGARGCDHAIDQAIQIAKDNGIAVHADRTLHQTEDRGPLVTK